jgi:hypothetical protein
MSPFPKKPESLSDDLIWGVAGEHGIAAELGIPASKAYYLVARGAIPVERLGHKTIVASRKQLRRLTGNDSSESP